MWDIIVRGASDSSRCIKKPINQSTNSKYLVEFFLTCNILLTPLVIQKIGLSKSVKEILLKNMEKYTFL